MSKVSLRKVGSSYVTTIPSELVQELHLVSNKFEVRGKRPARAHARDARTRSGIKAHDKVPRYRAAFSGW